MRRRYFAYGSYAKTTLDDVRQPLTPSSSRTMSMHPPRDDGRGRRADVPEEIPPRGWKDVVVRVAKGFSRDNVTLAAAGLSFYAMLAVFPALIALVSLYGLVHDPHDVATQMQAVAGMIPESARKLLFDQLTAIVTSSKSGLSFGAIVALLGFLWSAASGTKSLLQALNIPYHEEQKRSWLRLTLISIGFTVAAIIAVTVAVGVITVLPALVRAIGLGDVGTTLVTWLRWPALAVMVLVSLALLYAYGPDRERPKFRWVTWGSVVAAVMWIGASLLFSWYATSFGKFNQTYGTLGGIIVLLMWFYISAIAVLFGGEVNAELEHQTAKDTTTGAPEPMGRRGATMADTLGEATT